MVYRAIGLMSGSSLDGLDLVFVEFSENGGKWTFDIQAADCEPYPAAWITRLSAATRLSALDYQLLHTDYGRYLGDRVNAFIARHHLEYRVALVASHGHTSFHLPSRNMTAQLGDGATIAAVTRLPVVSDLRAMDVALGGQGAPIVPLGEKMLLPAYPFLLNLGGIANVSILRADDRLQAFDVCPANRILNLLSARVGKPYDDNGMLAATGLINEALLRQLNALDFYAAPAPKSLANDFGTETLYPLIEASGCSVEDALATMVEHIALQIARALQGTLNDQQAENDPNALQQMLMTGGGAFNGFLVKRIAAQLIAHHIEVVVPDEKLVQFKEALIMALIGVLRWREEVTVLASVTGAERDSVGGALWMGTS